MEIIFLVGLPGSGKSTVAGIIKKHFSFNVLEFGDIIRKECKKRYGSLDPFFMEKTVKWFHTNGREKILSKKMWEKIQGMKKVVIIGCRNKNQFLEFCRLAGQKPVIIYVYSPRKFRWKLLQKRRREDFGGYSYLIERDRRELEQGLKYMIKIARFRISNRSTKKELERKTLKTMKIINRKNSKRF